MNAKQEKRIVSVSAEEQVKGIMQSLEVMDEVIDLLQTKLRPCTEVESPSPISPNALASDMDESLLVSYPPLNEALNTIFSRLENRKSRIISICERITL